MPLLYKWYHMIIKMVVADALKSTKRFGPNPAKRDNDQKRKSEQSGLEVSAEDKLHSLSKLTSPDLDTTQAPY